MRMLNKDERVLWFSEKGNKPKHTLGLVLYNEGSSVHSVSVFLWRMDIMQPQWKVWQGSKKQYGPRLIPRSSSVFSLTRRQGLTPQVSLFWSSTKMSLVRTEWEDQIKSGLTQKWKRGREVTADATVQFSFFGMNTVVNLKPCNAYDFCSFVLMDYCYCFIVLSVHFHSALLHWTNTLVEILKTEKLNKNRNIFLWKIENLHSGGISMW